jgi:hypothetical protein
MAYKEGSHELFDEEQLSKARSLVADRIEANGSAVDDVSAIPKSRDTILVKVRVDGTDEDRYTTVSREDLA